MRVEFSASIEVPGVSRSARFVALMSFVTAALVAIASLGGILAPATYARETTLWRTEGIGQDWANVVVAVPWLVASAAFVLRGSRRGRLLLAGGLVYTAYTYAVYAFDVHFNALFLIYCGALGTSAYGLFSLAPDLRDAASWFDSRVPRRFTSIFSIACALAFALLWLSQIVPALLRGTAPAEVNAAGLATNPAHVLDLALVLPALFVGGWLLWHERPLGYAVVPVLLGFLVLMGAALAAMMVALIAEHLATSPALAVVFAVLAALGACAIVWMLHAMAPEPSARAMARVGAG